MTGGGRTLSVLASLAMLGAVVAGLAVIGSPAHQRQLRLDQRRVVDLQLLASSIDIYWSAHKALPATLEELHLNPGAGRDPLDGAPYRYAVTGPGRFQLCATFGLASPDDQPAGYGLTRTVDWRHPAGAHCFDGDVHATAPSTPAGAMTPFIPR